MWIICEIVVYPNLTQQNNGYQWKFQIIHLYFLAETPDLTIFLQAVVVPIIVPTYTDEVTKKDAEDWKWLLIMVSDSAYGYNLPDNFIAMWMSPNVTLTWKFIAFTARLLF